MQKGSNPFSRNWIALQKYQQSFLLGIQNAMEYRANFLLSMVSAAFPIFIQYFLWSAIYQGRRDSAINGYSYAAIIAYTVLAAVTNRLIRTGFEYEINDDIKNGGLNKFIVKPVDYFAYRMACFIGQKLIQSLFVGLMLAAVLWLLARCYGLSFGAPQVVLFCLALLLAFLLNFMIFFAVATVAFWLLEIGFLFEAVRIVFIALSGGIFPLDIFGAGVARFLGFLPFKYTINFPVELLTGRLHPAAAGRGFLLQIVWLVIFAGVAKLLWRAGSKRYVAVGG